MTAYIYPNSVNKCSEYTRACNFISDCVNDESRQSELLPFINDIFFGGSSLAPKAWEDIKTIHIPYAQARGGDVVLKEKRSFQAALGFVEGVPVIGTVLAIFTVIGHFFLSVRSAGALGAAVREWDAKCEMDSDEDKAALAEKVINNALSTALQWQLLWGAALGLLPMLKPITRVAQVAAFHLCEEAAAAA